MAEVDDRALGCRASVPTAKQQSGLRAATLPRNGALLRSLRRGASVRHVALTNLFIGASGTFTGVFAARVFGPEGRGEFAAVQLPGLVVAGFAMLGLPDAMVHFLSKGTGDSQKIVRIGTTAALAASLIFAVLGVPLVPHLLDGSRPSVVRLAQLWMLLPAVTAFSGMPLMALRGARFESDWNLLRSVAALLWLGVLAGCWFVSPDSRLAAAMIGQLVAMTSLGVVSWAVLRVRTGISVGVSLAGARPMLAYGLPLAFTSLPQVINFRFDQLLLVRQVSSLQLGLYVTAVAWSSLIAPIVSAFGIVLFPRLSSEDTPSKAAAIFLRYFRPALAAGIGLSIFAALSSSSVIPLLFGAGYSGAVRPAWVLSFAGGILAVSGVLAGTLQGLAATKAVLWTELLGLGATVILLLGLVPRYGIMGAAIASLLAYSVTAAGRLIVVMSLLNQPLRSLLFNQTRSADCRHEDSTGRSTR